MAQTPDNSLTKSYRFLLYLMASSIFLAVTSVAMLGPLLVEMASALDTSVPIVGQLVTAVAVAWAITALLVGPISDTYGRKPVLLLGTGLLALGAFGLGLTSTLPIAFGSSVLIGIGGGMVPPSCISLVGDLFPERERPMRIAVLTMQPGMSSVLGIPAAVLLADYAGWRVSFIVLAMALIPVTCLLFFLVPYRRLSVTKVDLPGHFRHVAALPTTWHMATANLLARVAWGVIITFFPAFLIVTYGLEAAAVALPVAVVALFTTVAPLLGGRIARIRHRFIVTATLVLIATFPGLGVFLADWGPWPAVGMAGLIMLLTVPLTTVLLIVIAETAGASRGGVGGVISFSNWVGTATGAAIGGFLVAKIGYGALSLLLVCAIFVSGLIMALAINDNAMARAKAHFQATS